nr:CueP family metal-binding protein [Arthrobacter sp. JCM 19049]
MQNSDVKVTVTDNKTGQKLVDESMQTFDNGFVGLWLPRGMEGTLTVEAQGKSGTTNISTVSDEDATCLTTLQLT